MNLTHYVSLDVAKELFRLDITKNIETEYGFLLTSRLDKDHLTPMESMNVRSIGTHWIPAPSLMEIMDRLPGYAVFQHNKKWICGKIEQADAHWDIDVWSSIGVTTAPDAAAEMLIKLNKDKQQG